MTPPSALRRGRRRRPVGLYPDRPDWHSFALGACGLLGAGALCLYLAAHVVN